jgi:hypothetical protein
VIFIIAYSATLAIIQMKLKVLNLIAIYGLIFFVNTHKIGLFGSGNGALAILPPLPSHRRAAQLLLHRFHDVYGHLSPHALSPALPQTARSRLEGRAAGFG